MSILLRAIIANLLRRTFTILQHILKTLLVNLFLYASIVFMYY